MAGIISLLGITNPAFAGQDAPSDLPASPLFGATDFSQAMLRFEEFGVQPLPAPGTATAKFSPAPSTCDGRPSTGAMDTFLDTPLWPDPTEEANVDLGNPWEAMIEPCIGLPATFTGVIEGRPPGVSFAHQRWEEFPPQVAFQTATGGSRVNGGIRDDEQSHNFALGEFGPGGLYHNVVGGLFPDATFGGIAIKFHPLMPEQDPNSLWTFGDGTTLLRHYNALPIDVTANNGFGEHTITTHEHNGHQPGESDGFAWAFFFPGQFYDYRWPMQLAGNDSINTNATDPRASTPCSPGETLMITLPASNNPGGGVPRPTLCDPVTHTVNIPGDWHEIMSTHWFHDHMIDRTSENVYKGNAAMMNYYSGMDRGHESFRCNYDDPAKNINLCFPSGTALDWGNRDYDVQLLVADKAWAPGSGQLDMAVLNEDGFLGDRMTVNWLYKPYLDVRSRRYRFRILNGSVARWFKIAIVREYNNATTGEFPGPAGSNKSYDRIPFHMVANDGNIMEHAVPFPNNQSKDLPVQAIAERYDTIIDFSAYPAGTRIHMVNTLSFDNGKGPKEVIPLADILSGDFNPVATFGGCTIDCWDLDPTIGKFLEFRVQAYTGTDLSMNPADYEVGKKMMIPLVKFTDAELAAATHRTFVFGRGGGSATDGRPTPWTISTDGGSALTATRGVVSAAPETMGGGVEIWHVKNGGGGGGHPVHIHFEEGQYLTRGDTIFGVDGDHAPPLWEIGARKDMYRVSDLGLNLGLPDSSMNISVAIRFREFAGTYVEHCHNTTHEDKAMLLRWDNEHPGQTVRLPTPIPDWDGVSYVPTAELATIKTGDVLAAATYVVPLQLTGDINNDMTVNTLDLALMRAHLPSLGLFAGNLNEDAAVNTIDLAILRPQLGQVTGIPLPTPLP
jgi:FtsP/CotA-like multicopper oxidase with cupredoxin domain